MKSKTQHGVSHILADQLLYLLLIQLHTACYFIECEKNPTERTLYTIIVFLPTSA